MPEGSGVGEGEAKALGEASGVGESDGTGDRVAVAIVAGVALAWAVPAGRATISTPAARIATTPMAVTAINAALWPVQVRLISVWSPLGEAGSQDS